MYYKIGILVDDDKDSGVIWKMRRSDVVGNDSGQNVDTNNNLTHAGKALDGYKWGYE